MTAVSNRKNNSLTRGKQVLRYPLKMFAEGTDYLQIDMMDYVPIATPIKTQTRHTFTETVIDSDYDPNNTKSTTEEILYESPLTEYQSYTRDGAQGFRRNSNKQPLGTILLPIPSNIQDGNSVNYTDDSMNTLVGAAMGGVEGIMTGVGQAVKDLDPQAAVNSFLKNVEGTLDASGLTLANAQDLATKYFAAQGINIFGGNVTLNQLLARQGGQIFNPNMELLFNSPSLRNFTFSFKMTPRSADESDEVKSIIRFFKRGMAPKADGNGLFLKTPNVFELRYRQGNEEHKFLHRFKQCFLTNISVNYTGDGVYSTYNDGTPVSMIMTLMFKELAPIYDIDYDEYTIGEGDERRDFKSPGGVGY